MARPLIRERPYTEFLNNFRKEKTCENRSHVEHKLLYNLTTIFFVVNPNTQGLNLDIFTAQKLRNYKLYIPPV